MCLLIACSLPAVVKYRSKMNRVGLPPKRLKTCLKCYHLYSRKGVGHSSVVIGIHSKVRHGLPEMCYSNRIFQDQTSIHKKVWIDSGLVHLYNRGHLDHGGVMAIHE